MAAATIGISPTFDDVTAAELIEKAMRNKEKQKVIDILANICNAQRQMIRTPYKVRYGKDLEEELKKNLSGELEDLIVALLQTPTKLDVLELHRAMKGIGTNEKVLIEILVSRTNEEMEAIRNVCLTNYNKSLEDFVAGDTSGDFKKLLMILIQGKRDETTFSNSFKASQDAQLMKSSLDKKSTVDKFDAFKVLATSNHHHVRKIAEEYQTLTGTPLEKTIEKEFSGDMKHLLQALLLVSQGHSRFFAHQIEQATKGFSTRDRDLIRVLVSRSELDLELIKEVYASIYNKKLTDVIREECKGVYRDALLSIVKGNLRH